ncbi:MAG: peptide chain release factor N(5)-glutamine methyltransferase [Bacteriovoracaceae bacterium]|nr:peptide chain release factor N(5)-glutamine methyltransferase [Bacteriovoracaceae bacterium]
MDWRAFYLKHKETLESHYPGLTKERFLREAEEIDDDGESFLKGVPFVYQLGYCEFAGFNFRITEDVLIPRPETEQLFELVSLEIKKHDSWKRIIDVGAGSGCLGLSLAKTFPYLQLSMSDISEEALLVAETNAYHLGVQTNILRSDLFQKITGLFDIIVSNPPYIPKSSKTVHPQTHEYEPHVALYVEDSEYEKFFTRLFSDVARHITADGMFFMEGHEEKLQDCLGWAKKCKLQDVQVLKDWAGVDRFLVAHAPKAPIG